MEGLTIQSSASLTTQPDINWTIALIADFQGDGRADILWRNRSTGAMSIWLMNGATIASTRELPSIDPNFKVIP